MSYGPEPEPETESSSMFSTREDEVNHQKLVEATKIDKLLFINYCSKQQNRQPRMEALTMGIQR